MLLFIAALGDNDYYQDMITKTGDNVELSALLLRQVWLLQRGLYSSHWKAPHVETPPGVKLSWLSGLKFSPNKALLSSVDLCNPRLARAFFGVGDFGFSG